MQEPRAGSMRQWDGALGYGFIDPPSPFEFEFELQTGSAVRVTTPTEATKLPNVPKDAAPAVDAQGGHRRAGVRPPLGSGARRVDVSGIDPEAIALLKANPESRDQFDEIFGEGAADQILGE